MVSDTVYPQVLDNIIIYGIGYYILPSPLFSLALSIIRQGKGRFVYNFLHCIQSNKSTKTPRKGYHACIGLYKKQGCARLLILQRFTALTLYSFTVYHFIVVKHEMIILYSLVSDCHALKLYRSKAKSTALVYACI